MGAARQSPTTADLWSDTEPERASCAIRAHRTTRACINTRSRADYGRTARRRNGTTRCPHRPGTCARRSGAHSDPQRATGTCTHTLACAAPHCRRGNRDGRRSACGPCPCGCPPPSTVSGTRTDRHHPARHRACPTARTDPHGHRCPQTACLSRCVRCQRALHQLRRHRPCAVRPANRTPHTPINITARRNCALSDAPNQPGNPRRAASGF